MFDRDFYIKRNREVAFALYGSRIDENRRVRGTNIWFDKEWRFHKGEVKED